MKTMKKILSFALTLAMLLGTLAIIVPFKASAYENTKTFTITGYDKALPTSAHSQIYVYTNTGSSTKTVHTDTYKLQASQFFIFDGAGKLCEAGANLYTGSGNPQSALSIPAGGFAVGFGTNASTELNNVYLMALEGAFINKETVHVAYDLKGSYNKSTNKLTLEYNSPKAPSANAKSFLFVGNSCTYFNGNPLKFKAIAAAAGVEVDVTYCTVGSSWLNQFANPNHNAGTNLTNCGQLFRDKIAAKKYDYVVLQDNSGATFKDSKPAIDILMPFIKENGATPVLYMRYASTANLDAREEKSYEHYRNYMQLAREYGIDMVALGGDAMMICARKYPEIEMLAQDRSHHSVEASYMIACCYAMTYLGIDVRGNSYTAGLPAATVAKLQECAYLACTEGYAYPKISYSEGNNGYENIAKMKPYTASGKAYNNESQYLTDTGANGLPLGKLTDTAYGWTGDDPAVGAYTGKTNDIIIDLKGTHVIKSVRTDLLGGTWGIADPNEMNVEISVSTDKVSWTKIGTATKSAATTNGEWKQRFFNLVTGNDTTVANYVKVTYSNSDSSIANNFFWSSDIQVFGYKTNDVSSDASDGNVVRFKNYTTTGIYAPDGVPSYPDEGGKSLTDGVIANRDASYDNVAFVGFNTQTDDCIRDGYASVTVDLNGAYSVNKFVARVSSANEYTTGAGVNVIKNVDFYYSTDGSNWIKAGSAAPSVSSTDTNATLTLNTPVIAKYVQYRFGSDGSWMMASEVEAYGEKYEGTIPSNPTDPSDDSSTSEDPSSSEDPSTSEPSDDSSDEPSNPDQPDPDQPIDPDQPDFLKGDINESGVIDSMDYVLLKRAYFGTYQLKDIAIGDINDSGVIDSMDYVYLRRAYFGTYIIK